VERGVEKEGGREWRMEEWKEGIRKKNENWKGGIVPHF
jgi:hypothetical protein